MTKRTTNLLTLILAESALETIPETLWKHPTIQRHSKMHRTHPQFILLDRSYHHRAMQRLGQNEKRGRPDIVHFALLEALGSPLNKDGLLQVYVHTINDYVIWVNPEVRLPRNCNRFVSLIEQLFETGQIPPDRYQRPLLKLKRQTLTRLMHEIKPTYSLALSRTGRPETVETAISKLTEEKNPVVIIGGFPKGHFSKATTALANEVVCVDREMLETWTVASRVIYEFERGISLLEKRLSQ